MSEVASSNSKSRRQAILVLGMHRSGTSAAAGVFTLLGAQPPDTPMPADQRNERGYAESLALVDFHDRLLASAGSSWRDWEPFDPHWASSPFAEAFAKELQQILADEYANAPIFVVKDPRLCRVLPFWLKQLEQLQIDPKVVLTIRNPLDVAASLEKRDRFPTKTSLLLWLRYVIDAEAATRDVPRCWMHYEDLLDDWGGTIERIGGALGVTWPNQSKRVKRDIDSFLSRELRHHGSSLEQVLLRADVSPWVKTVYEALSDRRVYENDSAARAALDQVRVNFDTACEMFHPLVTTEFRRSIANLENLSSKYAVREKKYKAREQQIDYIIWRWTQPFLWLVTKLGKSAPAENSVETPDPARQGSVMPSNSQEIVSPSSLPEYLLRGASDRRVRTTSQAIEIRFGALAASVEKNGSASDGDLSSIPDKLEFDFEPKSKIAVVCHVYYPSLWDELAQQIAQIAAAFDLFVTIADQPGAPDLAERIRSQYPDAQVRIVFNHGRDIFPFVSIVNSGILDSYYLVCKLHTKKSPHRGDGEYWRRKLLYGLLGSPENVADILRGFNASPQLGLVVADGEIYEGEKGWRGNRPRCAEIAQGAGISLDDYPPRLACSSFFWLRASVLKPLRSLNLTARTFEPENGAVDDTTAHAIERLFSFFAMSQGLSVVERSEIEGAMTHSGA